MEDLTIKLFEDYGENYAIVDRDFYHDLTIALKNKPNKIKYLNLLIKEIEEQECKKKNCVKNNCYILGVKSKAIQIINTKIEELENKNIVANYSQTNNVNHGQNMVIGNDNTTSVNVEGKKTDSSLSKTNMFLGIIGSIIAILLFLKSLNWISF